MFSLKNKVAIVTGASQGIGKEISLSLAKNGANVICISRNEKALKSVVRNIKKFKGEGSYFICDVTKIKNVQKKSKKLLRNILNNFSFFQICTLDKFNHRLIRSFSAELEEMIYSLGLEYWYTDNFVFRLGYLHDQEGWMLSLKNELKKHPVIESVFDVILPPNSTKLEILGHVAIKAVLGDLPDQEFR